MTEKKLFIDDLDHALTMAKVNTKFSEIIELLRLNEIISDEHIRETPARLSKMFINELFAGCYTEPPVIKIFEDSQSTPVISSNITIKSLCAHHFVPFIGKASIYYIPSNNKITGLSKFSRIAEYFSRRPQIQENLTRQIGEYLVKELQPEEFIIGIKAKHMCIVHRGANEDNPVTETYWTYAKGDAKISDTKLTYVMDSINYTG